MADSFTVARPYAKAVFQDALAANQLQQWSEVLQVLSCLAVDLKQHHALDNPKISQQQLMDVCDEIIKHVMPETTKQLGEKLDNFLRLLVQQKRLAIASDIGILYDELVREHEKVVELEVISAFELDATMRAKMQEALQKRFNSNIEVQYQHDPALIGGAVVRAGNWVMDGSVKGALSRMQDSLLEEITT